MTRLPEMQGEPKMRVELNTGKKKPIDPAEAAQMGYDLFEDGWKAENVYLGEQPDLYWNPKKNKFQWGLTVYSLHNKSTLDTALGNEPGIVPIDEIMLIPETESAWEQAIDALGGVSSYVPSPKAPSPESLEEQNPDMLVKVTGLWQEAKRRGVTAVGPGFITLRKLAIKILKTLYKPANLGEFEVPISDLVKTDNLAAVINGATISVNNMSPDDDGGLSATQSWSLEAGDIIPVAINEYMIKGVNEGKANYLTMAMDETGRFEYVVLYDYQTSQQLMIVPAKEMRILFATLDKIMDRVSSPGSPSFYPAESYIDYQSEGLRFSSDERERRRQAVIALLKGMVNQ